MTQKVINAFLQDEQGQDLVEYSLLLAFIALAAISMLKGVSTGMGTLFTNISAKLVAATPTS